MRVVVGRSRRDIDQPDSHSLQEREQPARLRQVVTVLWMEGIGAESVTIRARAAGHVLRYAQAGSAGPAGLRVGPVRQEVERRKTDGEGQAGRLPPNALDDLGKKARPVLERAAVTARTVDRRKQFVP